jgi:putative ABC transport system permease protein
LTYLFFDKVVLTNFVYHKPIDIMEMLLGPIGVVILAIAMIGTQTSKAATTNPADVLKSE